MPLRVATVADRIDAVVSDASHTARPPTQSQILAHAQVVEALAASNDAVLPARFGKALADENELRRRLEGRQEQLVTAFDRVRGCAEVGLRVVPANGNGGHHRPQSGREYMEHRLSQVGRAEQLARELHDSLAELARESTHRVLAKPDVLLTAAYLLPRGQIDAFRAAISAAERERPGVWLVCTGPWPPYSFALLDTAGK